MGRLTKKHITRIADAVEERIEIGCLTQRLSALTQLGSDCTALAILIG